ncbi:MAG: nucleotide exchange factor GrpE [Pseudomonadales bacterium]|nr:nucleotide exchange factor GrpE [Pseudomonadales bacterium]
MSDQTPEQPVTDVIGEAGVDVSVSAETLQQRIAELEARLRDQTLRSQAEIQNIQRRAERDVTQAHKYALEKFSGELLAIVDNMERALAASNPEDEATRMLRDGIILTHKIFLDALRKFQVEPLDPVGEPFNPEWHQAVSTQASTTAEPNSVLNVLQKGYTLNGRLLRPAIVVVSSAG